jgi:hypothetical protein
VVGRREFDREEREQNRYQQCGKNTSAPFGSHRLVIGDDRRSDESASGWAGGEGTAS